ncbi:MAG: nitrate/nitrite transporter NrtS [Gammaproteobacteria bacterium]
MHDWITIALRPDVVRRSRKVALLVGTILVAINYGDRIVFGSVGVPDFIKMIMTYCVPYCVSTYAAVSAIMAAERSSSKGET